MERRIGQGGGDRKHENDLKIKFSSMKGLIITSSSLEICEILNHSSGTRVALQIKICNVTYYCFLILTQICQAMGSWKVGIESRE